MNEKERKQEEKMKGVSGMRRIAVTNCYAFTKRLNKRGERSMS